MPVLVVEKGKDKGKRYPISDQTKVVVGREKTCTFALDDLMASRKHFQIEGRNGHYMLRDLGSSNGTLVNGQKIKVHSLELNDKIQVGESILSFLNDDQDLTQTADFKDGLILGYKLQDRVGRGGMGTVYLAEQISLQRKVALKILSKEYASDTNFVDLFIKEARAAGQLNHPNIVQVYDVGNVGDTYYFSMEYMSKGNVEELINCEGKIPIDRAIHIIIESAKGLEYAEKKRIIHRDIKPANIMINDEDMIKIGDLGIAHRIQGQEQSAEIEGISGSPHYIAPEHALGQPIDNRVDIYSLGVSFYQLLTGRTPYVGNSPKAIILKHINEDPLPLHEANPDLPQELRSIVERMMDKDPTNRFTNAREVIETLENYRRSRLATTHSPGDDQPTQAASPGTTALQQAQSDTATQDSPTTPGQDEPTMNMGMIRLVKKHALTVMALLVMVLVVLVILTVVFELQTQRNLELEEDFQEAQAYVDKGRYPEAQKIYQLIVSRDGKGEWGKKARTELSRVETMMAIRKRKKKRELEDKGEKEYGRLQREYQSIQGLDGYRQFLGEVELFLKEHPNLEVTDQAMVLKEKVEIDIRELENKRERQKRFAAEALKTYQAFVKEAKSLARLDKYASLMDRLDTFPAKYRNTVYDKKIQALRTFYLKEARHKFLQFLRDTTLSHTYRSIETKISQRKYNLALDKIRICQKNFTKLEQPILRKAMEVGLTVINELANTYLRQIDSRLKKRKSEVIKLLSAKENSVYTMGLQRYGKFVEEFNLKNALSALQSLKSAVNSPRYREEIEIYLRVTKNLISLKAKLIQYINKKQDKSSIYKYKTKYNHMIAATAVYAHWDWVKFRKKEGGSLFTEFWDRIKSKEIIKYFSILENSEGFRSRDYLALGVYSHYIGDRNKARYNLVMSTKKNDGNKSTSKYDHQLDKDATFFMNKL